jgi:hypothetical protein
MPSLRASFQRSSATAVGDRREIRSRAPIYLRVMDCDRAIERAKIHDCQEENQFTSRFPCLLSPSVRRTCFGPPGVPRRRFENAGMRVSPNLLPDRSSFFSPADCRYGRLREVRESSKPSTGRNLHEPEEAIQHFSIFQNPLAQTFKLSGPTRCPMKPRALNPHSHWLVKCHQGYFFSPRVQLSARLRRHWRKAL